MLLATHRNVIHTPVSDNSSRGNQPVRQMHAQGYGRDSAYSEKATSSFCTTAVAALMLSSYNLTVLMQHLVLHATKLTAPEPLWQLLWMLTCRHAYPML